MDKMKDIPGYYYDVEKKKYFKISKEFKRSKSSVAPKKIEKKERAIKKFESLPTALLNRSLYGSSGRTLRKIKQTYLINNLDFNVSSAKSIHSGYIPLSAKVNCDGKLVAMHMKSPASLNFREVICLYAAVPENVLDVNLICIAKVNIHECRITSFTWSPNQDNKVLFSLAKSHRLRPDCITKCSEVALFSRQGIVKLKRYNRKIIQCIAWNSYPKDNTLICTGEQQGRLMFKDINMYGHYVRPIVINSPPEVMQFCNTTPCLFIGTKSGKIFQHDYRTSNQVSFQCSTKQNYSIDCLKLLQDENYLLVSNWNGGIYLMDVRLRKAIQNYKGHVNNHSKLSFSLNSSNTNLFAVGSDFCLRIWDVRTGFLEKECRLDKTSDDLPVIEYSDTWSGRSSLSGLLCTYDRKYHLWPLIF